MSLLHTIRRVLGLHPHRRAEDRYNCTADVIAAMRRDLYQRRYNDCDSGAVRAAAEARRKHKQLTGPSVSA